MLRIPRSFRRQFLRPKSVLLTVIFLFLFDALLIASHNPRPIRTSTLPAQLQNEKIFIASINRNSEYVLRLYWNGAFLKLIEKLGPSNVFVSILESGSQEDTKGALRELGAKLNAMGVENKIELGIDVDAQEIEISNVPAEGEDRTGWIFTGRGEKGWEMRRIPYLARLRNQAMEPLMQREQEGKPRFDRILWINDVVFTTEDVLTLLSTRSGSYASACALDFGRNPSHYYDTFALRDDQGLKTATLRYPYFHSSSSREPLYTLSPIPVQSCWNGLISMTASPFYSSNDTTPLSFRGLPDSLANQHIEGSECCLVHADNPLSHTLGNWINPNVRVSYHADVYSKVNHGVLVKSDVFDEDYGTAGGDGRPWPGRRERVVGMWANRFVRLTGWGRVWSESWWAKGQVERWKRAGKYMNPPEERQEPGVECLVNEMQVLFENGWQHV